MTKIARMLVGVTTFACTIAYSQLADTTPISSGFTLEQLGFDYFGGTSQPNSTWGRFTVDPVGLQNATGISSGFVNMHVEGVGWAVQNLFVDSTDGLGLITTSFDLALGAPSDVPVLNVFVDYSSSPDPNSVAGVFMPNVPVGSDAVWTAQGVSDVAPIDIGAPFAAGAIQFQAQGQTEILASQRGSPNVQCATNQCFPMSIANSLQFLEDENPDFKVPHDHAKGLKGDNSLVVSSIRHRGGLLLLATTVRESRSFP